MKASIFRTSQKFERSAPYRIRRTLDLMPVLHIPVYLEQDIQAFLMQRATSKGVPLDRLVNDLLKPDIEAFRSLVEDPAA